MTVDVTALRRSLDDLMDRLAGTVSDDFYDWIADRVEEPMRHYICEKEGHIVVDDMCEIPAHRFCLVCQDHMPNVPLTEPET